MKICTESLDDIWIVTINRPEQRNCVDRETAEGLAAAFREFDDDDALRVAILEGDGGCFCAGADLKEASGGGSNANEVLSEAERQVFFPSLSALIDKSTGVEWLRALDRGTSHATR
jgi:enoyl-CoA hydratase/carnithine racemase